MGLDVDLFTITKDVCERHNLVKTINKPLCAPKYIDYHHHEEVIKKETGIEPTCSMRRNYIARDILIRYHGAADQYDYHLLSEKDIDDIINECEREIDDMKNKRIEFAPYMLPDYEEFLKNVRELREQANFSREYVGFNYCP